MSDHTYAPGEILSVVNGGLRVVRTRVDPAHGLVIDAEKVMKNGTTQRSSIFADAPDVEITVTVPANWPPRSGDLWRDCHGDLWFGASHWDDYDRDAQLVSATGKAFDARWDEDTNAAVKREYGRLTLVHREQNGGTS